MKKVKGTGERTLYVFSDADCPFCAKLEQELKNVDNVTIYTFLYPIDSLHPDAARKSRMIWCAEDRVKAWDDFYATGALPNNKGDCDNPVAKLAEVGARYKVERHAHAGIRRRLGRARRIARAASGGRARHQRGRGQEDRGRQEVVAARVMQGVLRPRRRISFTNLTRTRWRSSIS